MPKSSASKKRGGCDIVILDNLGNHKSKAVPIEQVFGKLKYLLRRATAGAVCAAIADALDAFTPQECANYLRNSGYRA